MKVRLRAAITGTRNGAEWPPRGAEMELPAEEAQDMIQAGLAEPVTTFRDAEKAVATPAETRAALVPSRKRASSKKA